MTRRTQEPQYRPILDKFEEKGLESLGLMTSQAWDDDPKRLTFTFARYEFVVKMMSGRQAPSPDSSTEFTRSTCSSTSTRTTKKNSSAKWFARSRRTASSSLGCRHWSRNLTPRRSAEPARELQRQGRDPGLFGRRREFEVFADDFASMAEQARTIASWGGNVNVKIPVTNTKTQSSAELIRTLSSEGVALNVTAIFTLDQVRAVADALDPKTGAIVSVFAGRIADTGIDPMPHMRACKQILASWSKAELLWASTRELLNIFQAEETGWHIITVPNEFLTKLDLVDKNLGEYSRETVQAFYRDATAAMFEIKINRFAAE